LAKITFKQFLYLKFLKLLALTQLRNGGPRGMVPEIDFIVNKFFTQLA